MLKKYNDVIGIVGGMGSFATLDFFKRLIKSFPAEKEWDRPRIIIDNNCTIPSRVRAILYNEAWDEVGDQLADSVRHLIGAGANILVLACNTSHVFLPEIINRVPEAEGKFVNIIDSLGETLAATGVTEYRLLASEGTLDSGVYQLYLKKYGITIEPPDKTEYPLFRSIIEDVKQDMVNPETAQKLIDAMHQGTNKNVIIGCTEFPPVYELCRDQLAAEGYHIYDPLDTTIQKIHAIIK